MLTIRPIGAVEEESISELTNGIDWNSHAEGTSTRSWVLIVI